MASRHKLRIFQTNNEIYWKKQTTKMQSIFLNGQRKRGTDKTNERSYFFK